MKTIMKKKYRRMTLAGTLCAILIAGVAAAAPEQAASLPPPEDGAFCFYVWSDTHFDGRDHAGIRDDAVDDMNRLAGKYWIAGYGICEPVRFVLHAGDVTTNGREEMWQNDDGFTDDDFLSCIGRLNYPVFETPGNHDADGDRDVVRQAVAERHGGTSYSFDYGSVHFISLGLTDGAPKPGSEELAWLEEDLADVDPSTPVILWQHFPLENNPSWDPFHQAIQGHNIALLIHGHTHQHKRYLWRGYDVWDAGNSDGRVNSWSSDPKVISVMKIGEGRLRACHYITTEDRWETTYMLDKALR